MQIVHRVKVEMGEMMSRIETLQVQQWLHCCKMSAPSMEYDRQSTSKLYRACSATL